MRDVRGHSRLLWCLTMALGSVAAQLNIIGRLTLGSKHLVARSQPAQDGKDETGEGDQSSKTPIDDGEVAGVMVEGDWHHLEVRCVQLHDWLAWCERSGGSDMVKSLVGERIGISREETGSMTITYGHNSTIVRPEKS